VHSFCLSRRGAEKSRDQAVGRAKKKPVTKLLPLGTSMAQGNPVLFGQTVIFRRWLIWFLGGGPQAAI
jgi:hypothetical protein